MKIEKIFDINKEPEKLNRGIEFLRRFREENEGTANEDRPFSPEEVKSLDEEMQKSDHSTPRPSPSRSEEDTSGSTNSMAAFDQWQRETEAREIHRDPPEQTS